MFTSYPRTPHLPWSPGVTADDVRAADLSGLVGREVVVTEKLDGENTTLYRAGLHARSLDSGHHPSRAWVKALHGRVASRIPDGWRVCGENLYARHSLPYAALDSYFYAFSVWAGDKCLSWDETALFAGRLGVPVPAVLWRGLFDARRLQALRVDAGRQEGYVVRAAAGFGRADFARRVAKWVRPRHVTTDEHWMYAPVVPNGLAAGAELWNVRSGGAPDVGALRAALAVDGGAGTNDRAETAGAPVDGHAGTNDRAKTAGAPVDGSAGTNDRAETGYVKPADAVADAAGRLDLAGRTGDARLAGVVAAMLHDRRRNELLPELVTPLGMPLARRIADLVGLAPRLHRAFPDEQRRAGLVRLAVAADLATLHAVAAATSDQDAREQVEWSALHADDADLLGVEPLAFLRDAAEAAVQEAGTMRYVRHGNAADRCYAEAWAAYATGKITSAAEVEAYTYRWSDGRFPAVTLTVGPSGSGKSYYIDRFKDEIIAMDDLRAARGDRADQRQNAKVLHEALDRLAAALTAGRSVVWDATSLTVRQRATVHNVASRYDAMTTHLVTAVTPAELYRRNGAREHPVPAGVLAAQLRRYTPPYPGEAHRTEYIGRPHWPLDVV